MGMLISNRRVFLKQVVGAGVLVGMAGILGCKSGPACEDQLGLSEEDKQTRQALQYVSKTPFADRNCMNCQLYVKAQEGESCGGCTILKGSVSPNGYCMSWSRKALL